MSLMPRTHMRAEIEEIPAAVRRLLADPGDALRNAGQRLRNADPAVIVTIGRGSSDHAATYLKYAIELTAGIPVASLGPSIASIYHAPLRLSRAACFAISQSGQSPDLLALAGNVRAAGALTFALTNAVGSPMAAVADLAVPLNAGPEKSVAATKSFVTSIVAGLAILAYWQEDKALHAALAALPGQFEQAIGQEWPALANALSAAGSLFVLGRGPAHAIANEAALKFKETCGLHAEAFSGAEILHGPAALVRRGFPIIALIARDAAEPAMAATVSRLAAQGGMVFASSTEATGAQLLPFVATGHSLTDPLALIVSFYAFIERLARQRGFNPDAPPDLSKVTKTL
jgi:glucosamine--fructose-6-phosphate aminotransferase (isomerizing)